MTQTLEQLSAAATEGEWRIHSAMLGHKGDIFSPTAKTVKDCHHIARFYAPKPDKPVNCELQAIGVERDAIQQIEANAAFVAALVNAYRTGQLVAVSDDGERPYLCSTHNQRYGYGEECPECEPVQADDVIQRVAELQLAAFLAGRGSIRTKDNGRTHVSLSGPTMDDYRRMAIAVMKGPKL